MFVCPSLVQAGVAGEGTVMGKAALVEEGRLAEGVGEEEQTLETVALLHPV